MNGVSGSTPWWKPKPTATDESPLQAASAGRLPFIALQAFTTLLFVAPQYQLPMLEPLHLPLLAATLALGSHLAQCFLAGQPVTIRAREFGIAAAILGWAILTLPFSTWPGGSVAVIRDSYVKSLLIFWLMGNVVNTSGRLRGVAWLLALASVPLSLSGFKNYLSGTFVKGGNDRIFGYDAPFTENPNDLALVLIIILPLAAGLFLIERRTWARLVLLGIMVLSVGCVVITFSRGGFFTLAAVLAIGLWKIGKRGRPGAAIAVAILALFCLPLLPGGYVERVSTSFNMEKDATGSAQARWEDAKAAVSFIVRNPVIGSGIGMDVLQLNKDVGPMWVGVHNVYLEYGMDLGLPGLILFLALLASCFASTRFAVQRAFLTPALRDVGYLGEAIQLSLIAFMVGGLFAPDAYKFPLHYIAGLCVAVKVVAAAAGTRGRAAPRAAHP
jgi:probable O-glycosylation ligase (exosortase A-associated)